MKDLLEVFITVWAKSIDLLKKPLGLPVLVTILLITFYFFGNSERKNGYATAKKDDSILIATKTGQVKYRDNRIIKLEAERDTLQKRLRDFDCTKETEKWNKLFQNLQASMMTKKADAERSLEVERRRTAEINKTLKSL